LLRPSSSSSVGTCFGFGVCPTKRAPRGPEVGIPEWLEGCEILDSGGTDYAYRLFVAKPAWMQVVAELAEESDYDNFKSEVARHQGKAGADYEHALHDVWSVMNRLQK
jgi:hypothetical protein